MARLRELRLAHEASSRPSHRPFTLAWLAAQMEIDRSLLYRYLIGERRMDPYRKVQIASILGMEPDDVLVTPREAA